jgi:hypothetical protein
MDADWFDTLARSLTAVGSRRRALTAAFAGSLGLLGLSHPDGSAAGGACKPACSECQTCKKGKCHKTKHGKVCKKGTCQAKAESIGCSTGRCQGGSCVAATGGNGCPEGQKPCGPACILAGQCCTSTDCPTGTTCCSHLCTDTTTDPRHCGDCITICSVGTTCAGGRCCTARGDDCTPADQCCGTDRCSVDLPNTTCEACSVAGCEHNPCCPGLFCVTLQTVFKTCVACMPKGESCQSIACCQGLFCQSGTCREPEPI